MNPAAVFIVWVVLIGCSSCTGASRPSFKASRQLLQRAPGNNNAAGTGTTYQIEGDRNHASLSATSAYIAQSVATNKAFMAAAAGRDSATSSMARSVNLKVFDKIGSGGRRLAGRAPGNNNPTGTGTTYQVEGDRNQASLSATSAYIAQSVATNKAFMAAAAGRDSATSSMARSVNLKVFDKLGSGGRRLAGRAPGNNNNNGPGTTYQVEGDRNTEGLSVTSEVISHAVSDNKARLAADIGQDLAFTTTRRSASPKAFDAVAAGDGGRRKLSQGAAGVGSFHQVEGDRNQASSSATSDVIGRAATANKAYLAATLGGQAARTATKRNVRLSFFDGLTREAPDGRKLMGASVEAVAAYETAKATIKHALTRDFFRGRLESGNEAENSAHVVGTATNMKP